MSLKTVLFRLPPRSRLLAALSGLMLALATPPFDLYFLAWIGLLPLFIALREPERGGFGEGFTAGFAFNVGILYWLALNDGTDWYVSVVTMFAAGLILAAAWGVAAWLFCRMRERLGEVAWVIVPFGWAALGRLAWPPR